MGGPDIYSYVSCVQQLSSTRFGNHSRWVSVRGEHYPTMFVDQPDGNRWVVPAYDIFIGSRLVMDSRWAWRELDVLSDFLKSGDVVVDAGANLGGFAIPLAKLVGLNGFV